MKKLISRILPRRRRGSGLATVLMVTAVMVTLAFTVVGLSFHHLSSTTRMSNQLYAKELAEDAIAKAIDQVLSNPAFGTTLTETVTVTSSGAPAGSFGALTFCPANATVLYGQNSEMSWHLSNNNLASDAPVAGDGTEVPGNAVYLSAVGICQGTARRVDAVVYVPKFPYALAASGQISGSNLFLAAVKAGGNVSNPADILPADLVSNYGSGTSVNFSAGNVIVDGDLQAASQVTLGNSIVKGEERLNANAVGLPTLNYTDYNTSTKPGVTNLGATVSGPISGYNFANNTLYAPSGLNLNGGVLYVNGDLNVGQGLSGQGAIIVSGTTTISGTSSFSGTNKVAIISHGPIALAGTPGTPSQLTGLLYSDSGIDASNTQLRGTVIANDPTGANGKIGVTQSQVYQDSSLSNFTVSVNTTTGSGSSTPLQAGPMVVGVGTPPAYSGGAQGYMATNGTVPARGNNSTFSATGFIAGLPAPPNDGFQVNLPVGLDPTIAPSRFWDASLQMYVAPVQFTSNDQDGNGNLVTPGIYRTVPDSSPGGYHYVPYTTGVVQPMAATDYVYQTGVGTYMPANNPAWITGAGTTAYLTALNQFALSSRGSALTPAEQSLASGVFQANMNALWLPNVSKVTGLGVGIANAERVGPTQVFSFQSATDPSYVPPVGTTSTSQWGLNLNADNIIPLAQAVRIMYWRDIQ